jgi:hypothetical protein
VTALRAPTRTRRRVARSWRWERPRPRRTQPTPAALIITADPPVHALLRHPEPDRGLIHRNTRRGLQDSAVASFSALHCPARGHRVNSGPAGRRMRLALPIIGAAPTHQGFGACGKYGAEQQYRRKARIVIGACSSPGYQGCRLG